MTDFIKWLSGQSDRVLLIVTLCVGGYFFHKVMNKVVAHCEEEKAALLSELKSSRESHAEERQVYCSQMNDMNEKVFENCHEITNVTSRCIDVLNRVEKKL